jgi:hypothetical protein
MRERAALDELIALSADLQIEVARFKRTEATSGPGHNPLSARALCGERSGALKELGHGPSAHRTKVGTTPLGLSAR